MFPKNTTFTYHNTYTQGMLEGLFDIKNDRRLSMYLYRMGFGMWLLYLALGAPALHFYKHYRQNAGVLCILLMVVGFSASMVFDYVHNHEAYEYKKKWLFISYLFLAGVVYLLEFQQKGVGFDWSWLVRWFV